MPSRPLLSILTGLCLFVVVAGVLAAPGYARPQATGAPAGPVPPCRIEAEIGQGAAVIAPRGPTRGYRGDLVYRVSEAPVVVMAIVSDFEPNKPPVDRFTITIDEGEAAGRADSERGLSGEFGAVSGQSFTAVRGEANDTIETAWFNDLMAGKTIAAASGKGTVPLSVSARVLNHDYNLLLDLLQIVAGWEAAGLCRNRAE